MRVHMPGVDATWEVAADLSASQFCFVKGSAGVANGVQARVSLCGAGESMVGILQNKPAVIGLGGVVRIPGGGKSKLKVDGNASAIAVNDLLKSDVNGKGVKAASGEQVGAIAMEASTADGDIIEVISVRFSM